MSLHILYTANLRGNIEILPRLYTFIKELRRDAVRFAPEDEGEVLVCAVQPPTPPRVLLLDLAGSCAPDVWHCAATGGRSMLIALDAMGYDAAYIAGMLTPDNQEKLRENLMAMALVENGQFIPSTREGDSAHQNLHINLRPAASTRLDGQSLSLADISGMQVGVAQVGGLDTRPVLLGSGFFDLPPNTPPDPTIAGAVDFILAEARRYGRKTP